LNHSVRLVCPFAHVFPHPNKIDLRGIFKAAASLSNGAEGRYLRLAHKPGVEIRAVGHFLPLDTRRAVAALGRDATGIEVRRFDDVCISRDDLVISHGGSSSSCLCPVSILQHLSASGWLFGFLDQQKAATITSISQHRK